MSTDPRAKLFYGYVKPPEDDQEYDEEWNEESLWSKAHAISVHGCAVDIYGYSESLGYFLAVKESLHVTEWDTVKNIDIIELGANSLERPWNEMLHSAAKEFGIDLSGLALGWHLVCLYF